MTHFMDNLKFLYLESGSKTVGEFANKIGLGRTIISRLLNGSREPNVHNLFVISKYCGMDSDDLSFEESRFRDIYFSKTINSDYMIHALKTISSNLKRCQEIFPKYKGQYIVYTNATKDGMVIASLLEIIRPTKNGIEFTMTNPYLGVSGEYSTFKYKGYMMPVDEFLYFIAEQKDGHYEILSMMFYASGLPQTELLEGLWSGIGVKNDQKYIASVPAIAVRRKKEIENWRDVLGKKLGYLETTTLAEMVQKKLKTGIIKISR